MSRGRRSAASAAAGPSGPMTRSRSRARTSDARAREETHPTQASRAATPLPKSALRKRNITDLPSTSAAASTSNPDPEHSSNETSGADSLTSLSKRKRDESPRSESAERGEWVGTWLRNNSDKLGHPDLRKSVWIKHVCFPFCHPAYINCDHFSLILATAAGRPNGTAMSQSQGP